MQNVARFVLIRGPMVHTFLPVFARMAATESPPIPEPMIMASSDEGTLSGEKLALRILSRSF